jgi:putative transposase
MDWKTLLAYISGSVDEELLLRNELSEYVAHHHTERPHQGKGNVILVPSAQGEPDLNSPIECRERLGGLLNYYHRKAA